MFAHEMEVQRRWPKQSGRRRKSSVAEGRRNRVSCGGVGTPKQLQRDRERDDQPKLHGRRREETAAAQRWQGARGKSRREKEETTTTTTQRWQHNGGSGSTRDGGSGSTGARVEWPEFAERNGGDSAREEEMGSRFEP